MAQTKNDAPERRSRAELIAAIGEARAGMSADAAELSDLVNVPKRIRATLKDAPISKAASAVIAGFVGSTLLSKKRDRPERTRSGWLHKFFPDFEVQDIFRFLLKSYLEPGHVDLATLVRTKLRDLLR